MRWFILAGTGDYEGTENARETVSAAWTGTHWALGPRLYDSKKKVREVFATLTPPKGATWMKAVPARKDVGELALQLGIPISEALDRDA